MENGGNKYVFVRDSDKSKITARVILYENELEAKCDENVGVEQNFKIEFKTSTEIIQKRSGNPGYFDGYPIKIGKQVL